ncbi:MAG: outer membrane lipoprotein carrier protein LolA [Pseudomonadota bacterium]
MKHVTRIVCIALATAAMSLPAAALEKLTLDEISAYLNGFLSASGQFTQINDDGTISTGKIFLKRPGKVRFEYNPPEDMLVVADGSRVGVVDGKSNTGPEAYPLGRTPLKIILARKVDFSQERMVTGHVGDGTSTTVKAQDPENPEYGSIELVFTGSPVELRQWVINDGSGARTTVVLGNLETGVRIDDEAFIIPGLEGREVER